MVIYSSVHFLYHISILFYDIDIQKSKPLRKKLQSYYSKLDISLQFII
jgi:hypothetical protein